MTVLEQIRKERERTEKAIRDARDRGALRIAAIRARCSHHWVFIEEDRHAYDCWQCKLCEDTFSSRTGSPPGKCYPRPK